jgi:DNA mismatch endonuclease (patch repair protein)
MDTLTSTDRSALMARVRATGNKSTEGIVVAALREAQITGWRRHPTHILGRPDFYFRTARLALFIDGCFWHACPKCGRIPKTRTRFWREKIESNRRRDIRTSRSLRRQGYQVVRVWEHEVKRSAWLGRLRRALSRSVLTSKGPNERVVGH